jgi:Mg2+/Co2+ transporter CorC
MLPGNNQKAKLVTYGDHVIERLVGKIENEFLDSAEEEVRRLADPS